MAACLAVPLPVSAATPSPVPVPLPRVTSYALDVNDDGVVIGQADLPFSPLSRVFVSAPTSGYTILDDPAVRSSRAVAINDAGVVAGVNRFWSDSGDLPAAFLWSATTGLVNVVDDGNETTAVDLNEQGQLLVTSATSDGVPDSRVYLTDLTGERIYLPEVGGRRLEPTDLTDSGMVVGYATNPTSCCGEPFVWTQQGITYLDDLGGTSEYTVPTAANNDGLVVGSSPAPSGDVHAVLWRENGELVDLGGLPGASESRALKINETGMVIGNSGGRGFVWTEHDGLRDLGTLGGYDSYPVDVNDEGIVIGHSRNADGVWRGFAWTETTGMVDLGPVSVAAINKAGLAAGTATIDGWTQAHTWDLANMDVVPTPPGVPRSVTAAAGSGLASVAWAAPTQNGGFPITSYKVTSSEGHTETVPARTDGEPHMATVDGLVDGQEYTFTVTAMNEVGWGLPSAASGPVIPRSGAGTPVVAAGTAIPDSGGQVRTGWWPSVEQPITSEVTVPAGTQGGLISIAQGPVELTPPTGFTFFGQQVDIEAPRASADQPLNLRFRIHTTMDPASIEVFRTADNGTPTLVADCLVPDSWVAAPDPCVSRRVSYGSDGVELVVKTSAASAWNVGVASEPPYPFTGFFAPVRSGQGFTPVRAGDTLPLKFELGGDRGLDVLEPGYARSVQVSCDPAATLLGESSATQGSLSYQRTTQRYTYLWRTEKTHIDTCRRFDMTLKDRTTHTVLVRLTR